VEDTRATTRTTTVQLNQPIELAGKRSARIAIAERGRDIADIELATRRAEIRASVVSTFFDVLSAQERTRLAKETVILAERATGPSPSVSSPEKPLPSRRPRRASRKPGSGSNWLRLKVSCGLPVSD
jgi:cobalt-zinc-cadmium efflux system outer membrane protein